MGRKSFFLIFTMNPSAADIVREDQMVEVSEDNSCKFRWESKKDDFEVITGRVIDKGMKKDMVIKVIDKEGNVLPSSQKLNGVGTRRQEIEKERMRQKYALENHVQETAEVLVEEGIDALTNTLHPEPRRKRPSLPKFRDAETKQKIKEALEKIPCFQQTANKVELYAERGIYLDAAKINFLRLRFGLEPKKHFKALITLALPKRIRQMDGVSVSGLRGTVQLNPKLSETIALYVAKVFKEKGQDPKKISYDPESIIRNLLANSRRKAQTAPVTINDQPGPSQRAISPTEQQGPSTSIIHPSTSNIHPSTSPIMHPSTSDIHPSSSPVTQPSTSIIHPSTSNIHPSTSPIMHPSTSDIHPSSSPVTQPSTSIIHPSTSNIHPSTSPIMHPSTSGIYPSSSPVTQPSSKSPVSHPSVCDNSFPDYSSFNDEEIPNYSASNEDTVLGEHSYYEDISFNRVPPNQIIIEYGDY